MPVIFRLLTGSLKYFKKEVLYQVLIIVLLSAVITGSLMTGRSVKESLKKSASEHLGNADLLISSGVRYFSSELVNRIRENSDLACEGILQESGYCQSINSQKGASNIQIFGVNKGYYIFQGFDTFIIKPGEVAVNRKLADYLNVKKGDDIIIKYTQVSDIPSDAPFSPAGDAGNSKVMKVGNILEPEYNGNFSLSISQITPMNIFTNLSDLEDNQGSQLKINRILIKRDNINSLKSIGETLKHSLKPEDIGLRSSVVKQTGEIQLISDRIFIDDAMVSEISRLLPSSAPVITYLGNRFVFGMRSTPYSFVSALPSSLYPEIPAGNGMIINRWMADDLAVKEGDIIKMFWYSPDSLNKLIERNSDFIINRIVEMKGIWADSLLMPDFPGISGKESCSDWDAGIPIKMHEIRNKDEEYWNRYKGTPKAFINYKKGKELWGNNFGPATAIRYPAGLTEKEIMEKLNGSLDPEKMGFTIVDISGESAKAANESVDFGTLFLSLGFFVILASLVLLSFAVSSYFDSKKTHINTLFALGFRKRLIVRLIFSEVGLIGLTGCSIGAIAGYSVNLIITGALNTVWQGAVQTNTLEAGFNLIPVVSGLLMTFMTIIIFMAFKVSSFLKKLTQSKKIILRAPSILNNLVLLILSAIITITLIFLSVLFNNRQLFFSFSAGTILLLTLILLWRQIYISRNIHKTGKISRRQISNLYYSFNPSSAITPILFIAAGIFTVFITAANRMNFNEKQIGRSGGTGGYLLWCENTIPVKEDLNSKSGKESIGLDSDQLSQMSFIQMKRSSGNDASCLNLNHITAPPLLGVDPADFIAKRAFSFSKKIGGKSIADPWEYLNFTSENNTIYGIADQTVLEWGLKLKPGDTLVLRAESGQPLKIIIAGGLKSSVFQGVVLIGMGNFTKYYPSVSGSQVLLIDGNRALTDLYKSTLKERLENYGVNIETTTDRLASFYQVTNTYLSVFGIFGAIGMIIGIAGLGFVLLRNYNQRKPEFALMMAAGFHVKKIRRMILSEQISILIAGVSTGIISALVATFPSLTNNADIPWLFMFVMILAILVTGLLTLYLSVKSVTKKSLITSLKKN